MLDITAVATRVVSCPFPLVALDSTDDDPFALFVGADKAVIASLPVPDTSMTVRRFIPQYHRTLTTGAIRSVTGESIIALGDSSAAVTIHRVAFQSNAHTNASPPTNTVFIGEAMDHMGAVAHIAPVWPKDEVSFVCTCRGELGTVWALCTERPTARRLCTPNDIRRIFPQRAPLPECVPAATSQHGLAMLHADSGEALLRFDAPRNAAGPILALRSGKGDGNVFAALTAGGVVALYDTRRAGPPVCDIHLHKSLSSDRIPHKSRGEECGVNPAAPLLASYDGGMCNAWAALVAGQFYFMRSSGRDNVVSRSFALPSELIAPNCVPRGLCFAGGTLHVIASEPFE